MDVVAFSPWSGIAGGALIGLASAALLVLGGRVAGVSGIFGGVFFTTSADRPWRIAFVLGLPIGASLAAWATNDMHGFEMATAPGLLIVSGTLVGIGTQLGSGCTSGHGICGLARGSRRSIAATAVFMATGMVTVFVVRHVVGAMS